MSDRACTLALALCVLTVGPRAHAQEPTRPAALRTELARLGSEAASAYRVVDSLRRLETPSVVLRAGGRSLRVDTATVAPADVERLRDGLERGAAQLRERYGATAIRLVDSTTWSAYTGASRGVRNRSVTLRDRTLGVARTFSLPRPVDPERVAGIVLERAGAVLPQLAPALGTYVGQDVSLRPETEPFELAGRELALSTASAARRCALGAVLACRAVLTHASGGDGLALWYEPADYPALLSMPLVRISVVDADSLFFVDLNACTDERDADACARAVQQVPITTPFSTNLRGTLVRHAMELGGREAMTRLDAAVADGTAALPLLARVAGVSEDSLIMGWQRRTAETLAASRGGEAPLAVSTVVWCGLLLVGASVRRPS